MIVATSNCTIGDGWVLPEGFELKPWWPYKPLYPYPDCQGISITGIYGNTLEPTFKTVVKDTHTEYTFEVPGFSKETLVISVDVNTGMMSVTGQTSDRHVRHDVYLSNYCADNIKAECKDGVLIVKVGCKNQSPKTIEIT